MNSELYFCQLSDLIISKQANTVMTAEGKIKNLLPEEAIIKKISLLKPLPWTEYSEVELQRYLAQLNKNKWITLSYLSDEIFVRIQQKYRLKILNNFFTYECKTWKELKYEGSTSHVINAGKSLLLKSVSPTEIYLSIPNKFSTLSREISLPTNFSLLMDPYFQDKYFRAILLWIDSMTERSNNVQPSSNQINDCLEFVKVVLQDLGNSIVDIYNEVETIKVGKQSDFSKTDSKFTFILDYKNGLSIQSPTKNNNQLSQQTYNLDLNPIVLLQNPAKWTNIIQDLVQMHMYDINLQKKLNMH